MRINKIQWCRSAQLSAVAMLGLSLLAGDALGQNSSLNAGIDMAELRSLVGATNVDGSGVNVLQVEAASSVMTDASGNLVSETYAPNSGDGFFTNATITDIGNPQSTGSLSHATIVGRVLYGARTTETPETSFGVAPGVGSAGSPPIEALSANQFIDGLGFGNSTPTVQDYDVSNHSYIITTNPTFPESAAEDLLRRLDYSINEGNTTTVVGTNSSTLPAGLVQAYNTINVGLTNGNHSSGLTTLNVPGRIAIHVVADQSTGSYSTPIVSGAAAILHQTGAGTDATKQEVIKATILAGATKDEFPGWLRTETQPLDLVFGAGELNVVSNHLIQTGGEVNGGSSSAGASLISDITGWDYEEDLQAGDQLFYEFTIAPGESAEALSIALTWNLEVVDGNGSRFAFSAVANELANLSLELRDSSNAVVDSSNSVLDNIEHIYAPTLSAGTYQLVVSNLSANVSTDFGLAFRGTTFLLGDVNQDGVVDFLDIAPFIALLSAGDFLLEADLNGDGVVDFLDIAPFIAILSGA